MNTPSSDNGETPHTCTVGRRCEVNSSIAHFDRAAAVFIGAELRTERKRSKLPIDYANMACGLAKSSVSNIERGRVDVSLSNYVGLCEVYGVNAADLLQRALRVRNAKREKGEAS